MGNSSFKTCWSHEIQEEGYQPSPSQLKVRVSNNEDYMNYLAKSASKDLGSFYDKSQANSFYKENQIGPYLISEDKDHSYVNKMKKWKGILEQTPVGQSKKGKKRQTSPNEAKSTRVDNTVTTEGSLDVKNFQQHYQLVTNVLDSAILCSNTMDRQVMIDLLIEGPPNMRLRWSSWKVRLLTKQQNEHLDSKSIEDFEFKEIIAKDIKRTITWHPFFREGQSNEIGEGHYQLTKLLNSIAKKFPTLGYCQGMNFIAGFILLVSGGKFNESFLFMNQLIKSPKFLLYFIYIDKLPLMHFLEGLTSDLLKKHHPKLYARFQEIELTECFWIRKIILSLFLYSFTLNSCLRLWDFLLATSVFGAVSLILALVELNHDKLMSLDLMEFVEWFKGFENTDISVKHLLPLARDRYKISRKLIAQHASKDQNPNKLVKALQSYDNSKKFKTILKELIN